MRYILSFGYINFLILGYTFQLCPTLLGARGAWGAGGQTLLVGEEDRGVHQQGASPDTPGYNEKEGDDLERPFAEPPMSLRQSFLFLPGTVLLTRVSESTLRRAALWLREHRQTRVLVAGFCDPTGSEKCNHTLAERRGTAVGKLLVRYGVEPGQMVAIKGWEKAEPLCEPGPACQQLNRKARIFLAGRPPVPTK